MIESYFQRKDAYNVVLDVTPELAEAWLTHCNSHNRNLIDGHVDCLVREMKAGRWRLTHQGIAFSRNRVLLDGQHRLWAIVLSGVTVRMRVFFNESTETLDAIDAVRSRTNDQIISLAGGYGKVHRAVLATLRAVITGLGNYARRTANEEAELFGRHRDAILFAHEILPTARVRGIATAVVRAVLARAYYVVDHDELRHFATVLQSSVSSGEYDQPIVLLLQFLWSAAQGRRGRPEARECYGKTERALEAYLTGRTLHRLYATTAELFPLPEETNASSAA